MRGAGILPIGSDLMKDAQQLVNTMSATVTAENCLQAVPRHFGSGSGIAKQILQMGLHFGAIARDEKILAFAKEPLGIAPESAYERNAACERLEHANGGNAGQGGDVRPPGYVHRRTESAEDLRDAVIRQPSGILDASACQFAASGFRIAHAIDARLDAQRFYGVKQEFVQLVGALLISPIADPHQVAFELRLMGWLRFMVWLRLAVGRADESAAIVNAIAIAMAIPIAACVSIAGAVCAGAAPGTASGTGTAGFNHRVKHARIGRFVPNPGIVCPSILQINVADRSAEGEHAIIVRQIVGGDRFRIGAGTMMGIVE